MVDGVRSIRVFTHHEFGLPELAIRNFSEFGGPFLWMDMAKDRFDFHFGTGSCGRGCNLAFPVSHIVKCGRADRVLIGEFQFF